MNLIPISIKVMKRLHPVLFLLITTILAYGLLIPWLGFYWDDLPISWIRYTLGSESLTKYFSTNRPVWGLLYQLTTRLLPQIPIYWQIFALLWRWLDAVVVWGIARKLFPDQQHFALSLGLLFLLYPGFNQQWGSFLYSHFFIVLFFFLSSFYLMLNRRTIPALLLSALNLWMMEYFFVLELARPFVIWTSLRTEALAARERFKRTFSLWAPYLTIFALAVFSRLFIFNNQVYEFTVRDELTRTPLEAMFSLLQNILISLWTVTGAAWARIFQFPNLISDGPRTTVLYSFVVVTMGLLTFLLWQKSSQTLDGRTVRNVIGLGLVMLILAGPPFWLTDVPVSLGFPANRATLSFMLGASFVLAGLLELLPWRVKSALLIAAVALGAGRQFLWSNDFRRDWEAQKNLFWQMTWRAPALQPNTLVLMNEELSFYADNSLSAALNWIYDPFPQGDEIPYVLFYPTNRIGASLPEIKADLPIHFSYIAGEFKGNTSDAVAFYYDPPACLRLLDPDFDSENRFIPDDSLMREASALSDPTRILREPLALMPDIYGPEPVHGWCYYFEKADLARQFGDWSEVVRLGDQAFRLENDSPNNPIELFVFIEGYAHVGEWERAVELSKTSYRVSKEYVGPLLCRLWDRIETETSQGLRNEAKRREALSEVVKAFDCLP
ncbi:MAG TPA: hypothetical protein VNK49_05915 [Anaerolineales bacterium]|nr:hypothetical protein [Anaerolineales bacterium]